MLTMILRFVKRLTPTSLRSSTLSSPLAERGLYVPKTLFPACGREGGTS
jgi:hypothetical protein